MERRATLKEASSFFGKNFVGYDEIEKIKDKTGIQAPDDVPEIPFSLAELNLKCKDYLLLLGASQMANGKPVTLLSLREHFGIDPDKSEPCFYNQDWYMKESFMNRALNKKWYLIKKTLFDASRAESPEALKSQYKFPSGVLCAYAFFIYWFHASECLWQHDFVWCDDMDVSGDRVYVGKYYDINGLNKNGFSIHRHLALKNYYGSIEMI